MPDAKRWFNRDLSTVTPRYPGDGPRQQPARSPRCTGRAKPPPGHLHPLSKLPPSPPRSFPNSFLSFQCLVKRDLQEAIKLLSLIPLSPITPAFAHFPNGTSLTSKSNPKNPLGEIACSPSCRSEALQPRRDPGNEWGELGAVPSPPLHPSTLTQGYLPK